MRSIRGAAATVAVVVMVSGCGGDGPTDPSGPDIRGTYQGTHTFSIETVGGDPFDITCSGAISVGTSSGGTFGGTLRIDPCPLLGVEAPLTTPLSGTVQNNGAVRFTVIGQEGFVGGLQEEGCEVVEADEAFRGMVQASSFSASLEATVRCDDLEGDAVVTWSFQGATAS